MVRRILIVSASLLLLCALAGGPCLADSRSLRELVAVADPSVSIPMPPTVPRVKTRSRAAGPPSWTVSCLGDSVT